MDQPVSTNAFFHRVGRAPGRVADNNVRIPATATQATMISVTAPTSEKTENKLSGLKRTAPRIKPLRKTVLNACVVNVETGCRSQSSLS